jgi:hypothetical protein
MGAEKIPAAVKAEIKNYLEDPGRKRSTRESGEIPSIETDCKDMVIEDLTTTEIEANLSTVKAAELMRVANQTGVRLFNLIEKGREGEIWIWYVKPQNGRQFLEQAQLVGAIFNYQPGFQSSKTQEGKHTIHISKIWARW